jgi:hypothetical protein
MKADRVTGTYEGDDPQTLGVLLPGVAAEATITATIDGRAAETKFEHGLIFIVLPAAPQGKPCIFEIVRMAAK